MAGNPVIPPHKHPKWQAHTGKHVIEYEADTKKRCSKRNDRRKTLFQRSHELSVISGGKVFALFIDDNEKHWIYSSDDGLWETYNTTGLFRKNGGSRYDEASKIVDTTTTVPSADNESPFTLSFATEATAVSIRNLDVTASNIDVDLLLTSTPTSAERQPPSLSDEYHSEPPQQPTMCTQFSSVQQPMVSTVYLPPQQPMTSTSYLPPQHSMASNSYLPPQQPMGYTQLPPALQPIESSSYLPPQHPMMYMQFPSPQRPMVPTSYMPPQQDTVATPQPPPQTDVATLQPPPQTKVATLQPPLQTAVATPQPPLQTAVATPQPPTQTEVATLQPPPRTEVATLQPPPQTKVATPQPPPQDQQEPPLKERQTNVTASQNKTATGKSVKTFYPSKENKMRVKPKPLPRIKSTPPSSKRNTRTTRKRTLKFQNLMADLTKSRKTRKSIII